MKEQQDEVVIKDGKILIVSITEHSPEEAKYIFTFDRVESAFTSVREIIKRKFPKDYEKLYPEENADEE